MFQKNWAKNFFPPTVIFHWVIRFVFRFCAAESVITTEHEPRKCTFSYLLLSMYHQHQIAQRKVAENIVTLIWNYKTVITYCAVNNLRVWENKSDAMTHSFCFPPTRNNDAHIVIRNGMTMKIHLTRKFLLQFCRGMTRQILQLLCTKFNDYLF